MEKTRITRLCCLPWPRGVNSDPPPLLWRAPFTACGSSTLSNVMLGAVVFPCALLKGLLVMLPACVFATVGSVLILPTSLARCILNILFLTASSETMSWKRRAVLALLVLPMLALWLPTASLLVAVTFIASMGVGFVMAFNATYIAAFYWPESEIDDPMEFQVPQHWLDRVFFGFGETFVYVVDAADWFIEYYFDYLEPLSMHYVDPLSRKKPPPRGTRRTMRVATQAVEEGNGQRKIAEHFVLGAAGTANVLFSDDPNDSEGGGVAQDRRVVPLGHCYKGGELGTDAGQTFCNPLSVHSVRITMSSDGDSGSDQGGSGGTVLYHSNIGNKPEMHTSVEVSPPQSPSPMSETTASEWNIIRKETLRTTGIPLSNSRRCSEDVRASGGNVTGGDRSAMDEGVRRTEFGVGVMRVASRGQRSFGEWGLERSRTYGPCDARLCGCEKELRPGALVVTILHRTTTTKMTTSTSSLSGGTEKQNKLWRFCPKPECYGIRPEDIVELPPLPAAFPIDRLARVTVLEQLDLDKLGVKYYCT